MKRRICSILLSGIMVFSLCSQPVHGEENLQSGGITIEYCEHHTEHTAACGYVAPTEGHECGHVHDEGCGYQEVSECTHVHTEACGVDGESCTHQRDDDCGYAEGHVCEHVHDEECGYVEAFAGSPCGFVCNICGNHEEQAGTNLSEVVLAVQALIDALPDPVNITEDTFEEVAEMLEDIDAAKAELTEEEIEALDFTRYNAAISKMMELMGQSGAEEAAVMSLDGFSATGKPTGATVKTINLNAATLRPDSTWSTGGNLVYFGSYNGNPVAYRVLSSPNTQSTASDSLLMDCNTILVTKAFSSDGTNTWTNRNCTVRNWLNGAEFYDGSVFSGIEKTAIAETTLKKQNDYTAGVPSSSYKDYKKIRDYVFWLSAAEADGLYANNDARKKTGGLHGWWLRSAGSVENSKAGIVIQNGQIFIYDANNSDVGVSPALNVNLSSVIFASERGSFKAPTAGSLSEVQTSTATEWKLTLLDSRKTVKVTDGQSVTRQDTTITVPYTYADSYTANPVSQISVMITDKAYTESNAQVLYYGALQNTTITDGGASGTGTFTLPADLEGNTCGTDYYAYIIAEDVNGAQETDYASTPATITIPAASGSNPVTPDTPATPVNGKGLGVSIIADPTVPTAATDAWKGSYVYFGTYNSDPMKYRVLDRTTTDFGGTTMLLDCDSILWAGINSDNQSSRFDDDSDVWANSEIKTYLNGTFLSGYFTNLEQAAIAASSKANASTTDGNGRGYLNYDALCGEQIFLLDAKEATNTSYGYSNTGESVTNRKKTGDQYGWWLRSAGSSYSNTAGCVNNQTSGYIGYIYYGDIDNYGFGVSPALNVNLTSVIFSSVLSGTSGQTGTEYKLTLQDGNITITPGTITRNQSDQIKVPFTMGGTNAGNATRVSLMVLDKEYTAGNTNGAKLVAYEKLADAGNTSGTFTLTGDMKNGSYYYYILAEDVNDGNVTDYASAPVQITIPTSASKYAVTVANGTLSGGSTTGDYAQGDTVTITAGAAPSGKQFKEWEVVSGNITLASSTSATTTFTMPAEAVSVKANYEAIPVTEYTITASAGANGSITPSGTVKVAAGGSQTFTISPSSGYEIDTIKVDGSEVSSACNYTFSSVSADHSIEVTFKAVSRPPKPTPVTPKPMPAEQVEAVKYAPSLKTTNINGIQLEGWEAINKAIPTLNKNKQLHVNGTNQALLHIDLRSSGKTVPAFVIRTADKAVGIAGLHIFIGNGDAITFLSGNNLSGYKETNFDHKDTITEHTRTIEFLHRQPLGVTLLFHTTVPVKSAKVTVYKVVPNQSRVLVARTVSNEKGQVCFPISETATYILEY